MITIVMAIYNPNLDWLRQQLESLNVQSYGDIKLIALDDCSDQIPFEQIQNIFEETITDFPFQLHRNSENIGSNKTFEKLTEMAEGTYIAYCDQDDIWKPEKIAKCVETLMRENCLMVYSDMDIIDSNGDVTAHSITEVRRHHKFMSGEGLAPKLIFSNFVTGCTMMMNTQTAKEAIPFCPYMVHDHYLALFAANRGTLSMVQGNLVKYRIHQENQTPIMTGVFDKESYLQERIIKRKSRVTWLKNQMECDKLLQTELKEMELWLTAREKCFRGDKSQIKTIWKYRRFGQAIAIFEIVTSFLNEKIFMFFIGLNKKNLI